VGDETIARSTATRTLDHEHARGGKATKCVVTPELNDVCVRAARAVGGGVVAIDVLEGARPPRERSELHDGVRNSIDTNRVNIPAKMVDYVLAAAPR